uniref:hypothetical protein n=1 Tax=Polaromonas sp. TaxID=1869339 RepID=UPI0035659EC8
DAGDKLLLGVHTLQPGIVLRVQCLPGVKMLFARSEAAVVLGLFCGLINDYNVIIQLNNIIFIVFL